MGAQDDLSVNGICLPEFDHEIGLPDFAGTDIEFDIVHRRHGDSTACLSVSTFNFYGGLNDA